MVMDEAKPSRPVLSLGGALLIAIGLAVAGFAVGGRFQVIRVNDTVVIDRFTGTSQQCSVTLMACTRFDR